MDKELRQVERIIFNSPSIDVNVYPPLNESMQSSLDSEIAFYFQECCVAFLREFNNTWFIDIYFIFDIENIIQTRRFIIAPGFQMNAEDESAFFEFINHDFLSNDRTRGEMISKLKEIAPELHLNDYPDFGVTLFHCYFASGRNGIRELLFKAGLDQIAIHLDDIDCNLIATNIKSFFDGISIKMLRKLNSSHDVINLLKTKESRQNIVDIYRTYHNMLNDIDYLNQYQIRYMKDCICKNGGITFDKKTLLKLSDLASEHFITYMSGKDEGMVYYDYYLEYQKLLRTNDAYKVFFPMYPSLLPNNIDNFYELYWSLTYYIENERDIDKWICELSKQWREQYSYENDGFVVVIPSTLNDILQESRQQHNCLSNWSYIEQILREETVIIFLRKKEHIDKSLITIEIQEDVACQALLCNNKKPTYYYKKVIEHFAQEKGLTYYDD